MSLALAFASAVWASWGRDVRMREAERGSWRAVVSGLGSSGMGGELEGGSEGGIFVDPGFVRWSLLVKCRSFSALGQAAAPFSLC